MVFFVGARGLRQGDPVSPYLFVLIMEVLQLILHQFIDQDIGFSYHWKYQDLGLFQLCFADDLLLFCKADEPSIRLFRIGLHLFASLFRLHANPQKSQLILSKATQPGREAFLASLSFQVGHLPVRYIGLSLIASRLIISDCQPLFQKIDSRIHGWDGIRLSFAGRVQLIKSVLMALDVYWAMTFILPKGVSKEIEKRLCSFLWKGTASSGYLKVAWDQVCKPLAEGVQGLRDILALNRALMSRHLWAIIAWERNSIWVNWIVQTRLRDKSLWTVTKGKGSWGWRKLLKLRPIL
ncbi:UNVERIFIED_CONTAM: hypothetical protein Sradi_5729400 [Sesamum radiatum]|uniref:Reverse transcriptase domain-containing protein n=1 Tax=Sesamum radiatum TaxID=300843 RepID=A0AAW2L5Y8_SESRA